ncbi:MAG: hypothetical protein KatS3mg110_0511 [Pirellulaceae bacterium]|nr:MAG: hypothetical protein KatS3mg110_0511 [Pirellulaceae bacterium]
MVVGLPEGHYHRFGGGKPLGFGSVRLSIDWEKTHLANGNAWRTFYCTLQDTELPKLEPKELIEAFKTAVGQAYGGKFEEVSFIKAWLRAATGHPDNLPTHYPRARQEGQSGAVPPHPEGKAYEWFVENDRTGRNGGPNLCLPDLHRDTGLPIL